MADFEQDLRDGLGDKILDDDVARQVWSALANVSWYHPKSATEASYSFRAAGGLIAEFRGSGCYMDWYCSGPYAEVSDLVRRVLKKRGWIYDAHSEICDEPGCLADAGCGWPSEGGYRWTCSSHWKRNAEFTNAQ